MQHRVSSTISMYDLEHDQHVIEVRVPNSQDWSPLVHWAHLLRLAQVDALVPNKMQLVVIVHQLPLWFAVKKKIQNRLNFLFSRNRRFLRVALPWANWFDYVVRRCIPLVRQRRRFSARFVQSISTNQISYLRISWISQ